MSTHTIRQLNERHNKRRRFVTHKDRKALERAILINNEMERRREIRTGALRNNNKETERLVRFDYN